MDDPDPAFGDKSPASRDFIDAGRRSSKVIVHCTGGVSRSPAVILAYLCHLDGGLDAAVTLPRQTLGPQVGQAKMARSTSGGPTATEKTTTSNRRNVALSF